MSSVIYKRKQFARWLVPLLVVCMWSATGYRVAAETVVQLPVAHIGEVNRAAIDEQGTAHRQGWRGLHYEYKMAIAAEVDQPGPFEEFTVFPYIESLVWHEARVVQYLQIEDDAFAEEYARQASLYPEALLFQVAVVAPEQLLHEDDLQFVYEDSTGLRSQVTILAHELEEPTLFQKYPTAIVWFTVDLPDNVDDIAWFSVHGSHKSGTGQARAKWILRAE